MNGFAKFIARTAIPLGVIAVIVPVVLLDGRLTAGGEAGDRVPRPQRPLAVPSVGPAGQQAPFNYAMPRIVAGPGPVRLEGDFRLVPYGYKDDLLVSRKDMPPGEYVLTKEPSLVKASPQFKEPGYLPEGYKLAEAQGFGPANLPVAVNLLYEGPSFPLTVTRLRINQLPIDVYVPPVEGETIVRPDLISGVPIVREEAKSGSKFQLPVSVRFVTEGTLTVVEWRVSGADKAAAEFQEVLRVAESLIR